ncbi:MAG: ABC transporter permease [Clostridiaceae bacterium]
MKTSIRKMFREIALYKERTLLTLVGILIGITAFGTVLSAYSILEREMNKNFMDTNPASMIINVGNLDEKALKLVKINYSNLEVEARKTVQARISRDDGTFGTLSLRAVQDFSNLKVDMFSLEKGKFPSKPFEIVLERDDMKILKNLKTGIEEKVVIKLPQVGEENIQVTGLVHAPGLAPASMENFSYGFITIDALNKIGVSGWFDELHIVSYNNRFDREEMKKLSLAIKQLLVDNGYSVNSVVVPMPGKHPHADQLASLLFLLQAFAIIALLSACMIIINLLNFIMSQQTKQIAVMKAVGANPKDIAIPYFIYVLVISTCGFFISIPLSILGATGYSGFAAEILNFNITSSVIPSYVYILQLLISLIIPLLAASYPIYKSCTKSVKKGLTDEIVSYETNKYVKNIFPKSNNKVIMSINNLNRNRTRTILAVVALATGGILFMTSQNIVASIDKTVEVSNMAMSWDYDISLARNYPDDKLKSALKSIDGLDSFELWKGNEVLFKEQNGTFSSNYPIKIIPRDTHMVKSVEGVNVKNIKGSIIINNALIKEENWLRPGMSSQIEIKGKIATVMISEVVDEVPPLPGVYIYQDTFDELFGDIKSKQIILARADTRDNYEQRIITKQIESSFKDSDIEIAENWNIYVLRKAFADHLQVIVIFLSIISILAVMVGGFSISSAIGISISERKREIGVMRAVGAKKHQILNMITVEAILIGLMSWGIGCLMSYPLSIIVGNYFGRIFLDTNLQNTISLNGVIEWLVISTIISAAAGVIPAYRASTSPLKEMLSYE